MDKLKLEHVLRSVVAEACPSSDADLFDIEASSLIAEAIEKRPAPNVKGDVQARFTSEIANAVPHVAGYMEIIAATFSILHSFGYIGPRHKGPKPDLGELQKEWEDQLSRRGISRDKAHIIASRYTDDLAHAASDK